MSTHSFQKILDNTEREAALLSYLTKNVKVKKETVKQAADIEMLLQSISKQEQNKLNNKKRRIK